MTERDSVGSALVISFARHIHRQAQETDSGADFSKRTPKERGGGGIVQIFASHMKSKKWNKNFRSQCLGTF